MSREHGTGIGTDNDTFGLAEAHWEAGVVERHVHPRGAGRYELAPQESVSSEAPLRGGEAGAGAAARVPGEPPVLSPQEYRDRYQNNVHRLPPHPRFKDYLLFVPLAVYKFVDRLCDAFGFKFIWLLISIYGISQGLGETYMSMSTDYYLKEDLKMEPAAAQAIKSLIHLPWNIKPLYGLMSDTLPILGFHRGPYIFIAGALGTLAWMTLALNGTPTVGVSAFLFLLANYSIASPDVIIDAAVTERSQLAPIYASDLQSVSWGAHALGGIMGCTTVGQAQANLHSRGVFGINAFTPFVIMILAALRWLPEKRVPVAERKGSCRRGFAGGQRSLYLLAIFMAVCAVVLALTVTHVKDKMVGGGITIAVAIVVAVVVYMVLARISPKIARPAVFFFLRESVQPNIGEAMFFWYTSPPPLPHFSPKFLSVLDCVAMTSMIVGIALYNRYMSSWKYRTIFICSQFLMVGAGLLDYILVRRWNIKWGISDRAFVLGDEALIPLLRKFAAIPFFVLCAKVCPDNCEATLFALLMALSNFGGDVGSYIGVGLLRIFDVSRHDWTNLPKVVMIKTLARFIPILLIPFLIPDASPADEILTEKEKHLGEEASSEEDDDEEMEVELGAGAAGANGEEDGGVRGGGVVEMQMRPKASTIDSAGSGSGSSAVASSSPARRRPSVTGRAAAPSGGTAADLDVLGGAQLEGNRTIQ